MANSISTAVPVEEVLNDLHWQRAPQEWWNRTEPLSPVAAWSEHLWVSRDPVPKIETADSGSILLSKEATTPKAKNCVKWLSSFSGLHVNRRVTIIDTAVSWGWSKVSWGAQIYNWAWRAAAESQQHKIAIVAAVTSSKTVLTDGMFGTSMCIFPITCSKFSLSLSNTGTVSIFLTKTFLTYNWTNRSSGAIEWMQGDNGAGLQPPTPQWVNGLIGCPPSGPMSPKTLGLQTHPLCSLNSTSNDFVE